MFTPAFWSAVAAGFSAVAATLTLLVHRRNLLDAARPEIVVTGWERTTWGNKSDCVRVTSIKNVGRGPAFILRMDVFYKHQDRPVAVMSGNYLPILASGDQQDVNSDIVLSWGNAPEVGVGGPPMIFPSLRISCSDYRHYRHTTSYRMFISPVGREHVVAGAHLVAPGVNVSDRKVVSRPIWMLKFRARLASIPLVGRLFRSKQTLD